jgi:hypothetical protein
MLISNFSRKKIEDRCCTRQKIIWRKRKFRNPAAYVRCHFFYWTINVFIKTVFTQLFFRCLRKNSVMFHKQQNTGFFHFFFSLTFIAVSDGGCVAMALLQCFLVIGWILLKHSKNNKIVKKLFDKYFCIY